jgi:hypothetical protein
VVFLLSGSQKADKDREVSSLLKDFGDVGVMPCGVAACVGVAAGGDATTAGA